MLRAVERLFFPAVLLPHLRAYKTFNIDIVESRNAFWFLTKSSNLWLSLKESLLIRLDGLSIIVESFAGDSPAEDNFFHPFMLRKEMKLTEGSL